MNEEEASRRMKLSIMDGDCGLEPHFSARKKKMGGGGEGEGGEGRADCGARGGGERTEG